MLDDSYLKLSWTPQIYFSIPPIILVHTLTFFSSSTIKNANIFNSPPAGCLQKYVPLRGRPLMIWGVEEIEGEKFESIIKSITKPYSQINMVPLNVKRAL